MSLPHCFLLYCQSTSQLLGALSSRFTQSMSTADVFQMHNEQVGVQHHSQGYLQVDNKPFWLALGSGLGTTHEKRMSQRTIDAKQ